MSEQTTTLAKALTMVCAAMERDPKVVLMGEDIGKLGGVFRVTDGLQKDFGEARVWTPAGRRPHPRTAIACPARLPAGGRKSQFDGSCFPAFDADVCQLQMRAAAGAVKMRSWLRIPFGGGIGAVEHHSDPAKRTSAHTPVCAWWSAPTRSTRTG